MRRNEVCKNMESLTTLYNVIKSFSADLKIFWNPLTASALEKAKADYIQRGGKRDGSKF